MSSGSRYWEPERDVIAKPDDEVVYEHCVAKMKERAVVRKHRVGLVEVSQELLFKALRLPDGCKLRNIRVNDKLGVSMIIEHEALPETEEATVIPTVQATYREATGQFEFVRFEDVKPIDPAEVHSEFIPVGFDALDMVCEFFGVPKELLGDHGRPLLQE